MFRDIEKLIMDAARLADAVRVSQENWDMREKARTAISRDSPECQREQRTYPDVMPTSRIPHCVPCQCPFLCMWINVDISAMHSNHMATDR
jgi:hypothetical protein